MFRQTEFGEWEYVVPGICFVDGEGEEGGGEAAAEEGEGAKAGDDAGDEAGAEATAWRDSITDADARKFADSYASPAELAKAALGMRQKISKGLAPGADASDEEKAEYRKSQGIPDKADAYEIALPKDYEPNEHESAFHGRLKEAALKAGVPAAAFKALSEEYSVGFLEMGEALQAAEAEATQARVDKLREGLEKEWGDDFTANLNIANRASSVFGQDSDFQDLLDQKIEGVPLREHPAFAKVFANIGRKLGNDTLGDLSLNDDERQTLKEKHQELSGKIMDAIDNNDHELARRLERERDKITPRIAA